MLILPSNTLPFIWDFQSAQHWAFVLLMFRGPKRAWGSHRVRKLIQSKQHHPYAEDCDQIGQIRCIRGNQGKGTCISLPIEMVMKALLFPCVSALLTASDCERCSQAPRTRGTTSPCHRQEKKLRRGQRNFDSWEAEVKEKRLIFLVPKKGSQISPW